MSLCAGDVASVGTGGLNDDLIEVIYLCLMCLKTQVQYYSSNVANRIAENLSLEICFLLCITAIQYLEEVASRKSWIKL